MLRRDHLALAALLLACAGAARFLPSPPWNHLDDPPHQAALAMLVVLAALLVLRALGARGARAERILLGVFLASMPFVYVGAWRRAGAGGSLAVELLGVLLYGALALVGVLRAPQVLALGIAAHAVWDLAHYGRCPFMPDWYAIACAVADAGVAVYAASRIGRWRVVPATGGGGE